jgi:hypothetical protein
MLFYQPVDLASGVVQHVHDSQNSPLSLLLSGGFTDRFWLSRQMSNSMYDCLPPQTSMGNE